MVFEVIFCYNGGIGLCRSLCRFWLAISDDRIGCFILCLVYIDFLFFFGSAGIFFRMMNPAHGVLNVIGRQCQTSTD